MTCGFRASSFTGVLNISKAETFGLF